MAESETPDQSPETPEKPETTRTSERPREPERTTRRPQPELPEDPEELKAELLRAREQISRSNKDATTQRRRLEELEDAERKREEARLTEDERLKRQLKDESAKRAEAEAKAADAAARLRQALIDAEIVRLAREMDFEEPELTPKLIDPTQVVLDDEERVVGGKDALKKLAEKHKSLLRPKPSGGTPTRDQRGNRPARTGDSDEIKSQLLATGKYAQY